MINPAWQVGPANPELSSACIHIWSTSLDRTTQELAALWDTLSVDERARADAILPVRTKHHFVAARGWLREILGRYSGDDPANLRFSYTTNGKPELAFPSKGIRLQFNLAHSAGIALYAITQNRQLGIDIEAIVAHNDLDVVARRFFAPEEQASLASLAEVERLRAFYTCWTRKEAFIKAIGAGLTHPLNSFVVTLQPDQLPSLVSQHASVIPWSLHAIPVGSQYEAALAYEGQVDDIQYWRAEP